MAEADYLLSFGRCRRCRGDVAGRGGWAGLCALGWAAIAGYCALDALTRPRARARDR